MQENVLKKFFKRFSHNSASIKTVRYFRLRKIARILYYYFLRPANNILNVDFGGINVKYYARNPEELRLAESVSGEWGEKDVIEALIRELKPGDCFYDVGANIGIYSVIVAKILKENGTVVAFEPEKESASRLRDNINLNKLNNVIIVEKALGEKNGSSRLFMGKTVGHSSLLKIKERGVRWQDAEVVNGDDFVKKNRLPAPKAVKIDVEGYEHSALAGLFKTLSAPECKIVCIETHPYFFSAGNTEKQIFNLLKSLGFSKIIYSKRPYHLIISK